MHRILIKLNLLVVIYLITENVICQSNKRITNKIIPIDQDTFILDSLSLDINSIKVIGIDTKDYKINPITSQWIWQTKNRKKAKIFYRTILFDFNYQYFNKSESIIEKKNKIRPDPFKIQENNYYNKTNYSGIKKQGNLSRNMLFGNNQNLGIKSNVNIQLSGKLTPNLNILASISDKDVQLQSDGTSQQIQDFDQVYIQLFNYNHHFTIGDYQIKNRNSNFLRYNKRLRGVNYIYKFKYDNQWNIYYRLNLALSRGKFSRNIFNGIESNQGPYRLHGNEGESYIVILAGTERIYIDGKILKRGQDNDYIINYNNAEITFTTNQLITKDKRIIVEFQYVAQNYVRSLATNSIQFKNKKWQFDIQAYTEQDHKNESYQQNFTEQQLYFLESIGNNIENAYSLSAKETDFQDGEILYKLVRDTLQSGKIDSIFIFSTNPDSAIYRVSFLNVGIGNGNYIEVNNNENGKLYKYIKPIQGVKQGIYSPIQLLITPKLKQMLSLQSQYIINSNSKLNVELAISKNDLNLFSNKDNNQNTGHAFNIIYKYEKYLSKQKKWKYFSNMKFEYINKNFKQIERYRSVEFERDWNISPFSYIDNQFSPSISVGFKEHDFGTVSYSLTGYTLKNTYQAVKHKVNTNMNLKTLKIKHYLSAIKTNSDTTNTLFIRQKTLLKKQIKNIVLGYRDVFEQNDKKIKIDNQFKVGSYKFWEREYFVESLDSVKHQYKLMFNHRFDYLLDTISNQVRKTTKGEKVEILYSWYKNFDFRLKSKLAYRKLTILQIPLIENKPKNTFLGRFELQTKKLNNSIILNTFYELGSGVEEKKEYHYVKVTSGKGIYQWNDYNNNEIKEWNEFEIARFQDQANYIRVYKQTNEFIDVYTNQWSVVLHLIPSQYLESKKDKISDFIKKFSNQTVYKTSKKSKDKIQLFEFNPVKEQLNDINSLVIKSNFRNSLYFNKNHPKYGIEWDFQKNMNKQLLTNGVQNKFQNHQKMGVRYSFTNKTQLNFNVEKGNIILLTENIINQNYNIQYKKINPKLTYLPDVDWFISVAYLYNNKQNHVDYGAQKAIIQSYEFEFKKNKVRKYSFQTNLKYINIAYTGVDNSVLSYELLNGLNKGENYTLTLILQKFIGQYFQWNLTYFGRKISSGDIIHTGNINVSVLF